MTSDEVEVWYDHPDDFEGYPKGKWERLRVRIVDLDEEEAD